MNGAGWLISRVQAEYSREIVADPIQSYFEVLHRTNSMMIRTGKFRNSKFAYSMK